MADALVASGYPISGRGAALARASGMLRAVIVILALGVAVVCFCLPLLRAAVEDDVH